MKWQACENGFTYLFMYILHGRGGKRKEAFFVENCGFNAYCFSVKEKGSSSSSKCTARHQTN